MKNLIELNKFAEISAGGGAPQESEAFNENNEGNPFVRAGSLIKLLSGESETSLEHLTEDVARKYRLRLFPKDTILFAKSGMSATKGYIYQLKQLSYVVNHLAAIVPKKELLFAPFLKYWFQQNPPSRLIKDEAYPSIRLSEISEIKIPKISVDEQKRIAAVLDKADEVCVKRRAALGKLDYLLQSVFLDMFGDPVSNPKGWEVKNLGELLNFRTGKLDSNAAVSSGEYPFFTCSKETFQIDKYAFDCEALLLAGNNATADYSVKYYNGKFNAYQRTYVITLLNSTHSYLFMRYTLERKLGEMKKFSKGTNTKYLTLAILQNLKMPVPSSETQKEFERFHIEIDELKNKELKTQIQFNNLFQSLQQRAFTGELFGAELSETMENIN